VPLQTAMTLPEAASPSVMVSTAASTAPPWMPTSSTLMITRRAPDSLDGLAMAASLLCATW
jgi:hypothetical protein